MQLFHFIVGFAMLVVSMVSAGGSDDRVMGWNKAHGLWGKRSVDVSQDKRTPQNWNKLNSLWGKRSGLVIPDSESIDNDDDDVAVFYKRSPVAHWQRANGLWGR